MTALGPTDSEISQSDYHTCFYLQTWIALVHILLTLFGKNCGILFRIPYDIYEDNLVVRHPGPFPQNEVRGSLSHEMKIHHK